MWALGASLPASCRAFSGAGASASWSGAQGGGENQMQGSCASPRWVRLERGGPFTVPRPWPGPGVHIGARQVGRSLPGRVPSRQEGRYSLTQAGWCLWDVVPAVSSQPSPLPRGPPVCCIESRRREQPRRKGAPRPPQRAPARLPALLRLGPKRLGVRTRRAGARGRRVRIPRRRWGGRAGGTPWFGAAPGGGGVGAGRGQ